MDRFTSTAAILCASVVLAAFPTEGVRAQGSPPPSAPPRPEPGSLLEQYLREMEAEEASKGAAAGVDAAAPPATPAIADAGVDGVAIATGGSFSISWVPPSVLRGGVAMAIVERTNPATPWPESFDVAVAGHAHQPASCLAIETLAGQGAPSWADPVQWLASSRPVDQLQAWIIVPIPSDAPRQLVWPVAGPEPLTSRVMDPVAPGTLSVPDLTLDAGPGANTGSASPAARAPAEHMRDRIMAREIGLSVAPEVGQPLDRALAMALADRWDAALSGVAAVDPVAAERLAHALASVSRGAAEDGREVLLASWVSDPGQLDRLLTGLERSTRDGGPESAASFAREWVDDQPLIGVWIERLSEQGVVLGVMNGSFENRVLEATWLGAESTVTIPVLSGSYHSVVVPMPVQPAPGLKTLLVTSPGREWRFAVPPSVVPAHAPGVNFGPFFRTATLAETLQGVGSIAPAEWATDARLRRRPTGWELAIDVHRPIAEEGRDELIIDLPSRSARIIVPETGPTKVLSLATGEPMLDSPMNAKRIERLSGTASWSVTIELPAVWMGGERPSAGTLVPIAISRRIAGMGRFTPMRPLVPWNERGHEVVVDVGTWPLPDEPSTARRSLLAP